MLKFLKSAFKYSIAVFSFISTMFAMSEAIKKKKIIENKLNETEV